MGAEISIMHSNFIINNSSASSKDIYELITIVQQKVLQKRNLFATGSKNDWFDYPN